MGAMQSSKAWKWLSKSACAAALALDIGAATAMTAKAEVQISAYGGMNTNLSSDLQVRRPSAPPGTNGTYDVDWEGKSFEMPPYWGVRATYFLESNPAWGFGIEYTHAKAYADLKGDVGATFSTLEFTDGNNLVMLNAIRRFEPMSSFYNIRPYAGFGIGVTIPHVEVTLVGDTGPKTFEYQLAGFAAQGFVGLEMPLGKNWSAFAEGKFSYAHINADLDGGGYVKTNIWSPALALGLSYRF